MNQRLMNERNLNKTSMNPWNEDGSEGSGPYVEESDGIDISKDDGLADERDESEDYGSEDDGLEEYGSDVYGLMATIGRRRCNWE